MTNPDAAPASSDTRRIVAGIIGAALAVGMLLWALRGVHLEEVVDRIRDADPWPLIFGVVLASATFVIRLIRWRLLLRNEQGGPLPIWPLWHALAIGFMANNLLPFRAGELVRVFATTRLAGSRFPATLSSIAVERLFDGLATIALLALGLIFSNLPTGVTVGGVSLAYAAQMAGLLTFVAFTIVASIVAFPALAERVTRRVLPAGRLTDRLVGFLEGIRQGIASLRSPGVAFAVVAWSFILWVVNAAALWVSFAAFDIPVGLGGALVLQGVLVIGISVQLTPGFLGQFEAAIVAGLALYGIHNDIASSYAIAYHGATFVPITLAGAWSLARTPIALSDLQGRTGQ